MENLVKYRVRHHLEKMKLKYKISLLLFAMKIQFNIDFRNQK